MLPARVWSFVVLFLVVLPADQPPAAGQGPLFTALSRIEASPAARVETVVDRFTSVGSRVSDETRTLAGDDDVGLLAQALDSIGVDQAVFSTDAFRFANGDGKLLQYRALATGTGATKDGPFMVIAFAEPDHAAAVEQAARLEEIVRTGESSAARRRWSDVLAVSRLLTRGRVTLAVLPTKLDTLWLELERSPDTLVWWSQ